MVNLHLITLFKSIG